MEITKIDVTLEGFSDIMFDRFFDHSGEDRPPERKLYLDEGNKVVLPSECINSFLFRDLPPTGVIRFVEKRGAKDFIALGQAYLSISPLLIPFHDKNGKAIVFEKFGGASQFMVNDWSAGITKMSGGKVIKQEVRKRPILKLPWFLSFGITLIKNDKVTVEKLQSWFEIGGFATALGTYRPRHGRFVVKKWEVK
ncbi:MAG TPA: hypothetical protein PK416_03055 [Thermodesulfobacteriota bacterium]|nr:hypothetical protein [Thermodesulfobacteriota bacterium]